MVIAGVAGHRGFDDEMAWVPRGKADGRRGAEDSDSRAVASGGDMHRPRIIGDKESAVIEEGSQLQKGQFTSQDEDIAFIGDEG